MIPEELYAKEYNAQTYHCAHFVFDAWKAITGKDLPASFHSFLSGRNTATAYSPKMYADFKRVQKPSRPCVVLMRHGPSSLHVGVFVRNKIVQLRETGVTMLPPHVATFGYTDIRYYECL